MAQMQALNVENLKKIYANGVIALKGITLSVAEGDFFALLGPNGAGKSSTIGILTSLVNRTAGRVEIFGYDLDRDNAAAKACLGLVPQELNFNQFEKVMDIVVTQAGYYGIPRKTAVSRAAHYLKKLELWDKRDEISRTLSGGMKRRLMIARALVHEPRMLILDEPTAGVDVASRRAMWQFLQEINQQGVTIILTTHYLEEAEYLCRGIGVIDQGVLLTSTTIQEFLSRLSMETIVLDVKTNARDNDKITIKDCQVVFRAVEQQLEVSFPKTVMLTDIFQQLLTQGVQVTSMRNKANRLEELFVQLVASNQ